MSFVTPTPVRWWWWEAAFISRKAAPGIFLILRI
jgi:hypothetical protein